MQINKVSNQSFGHWREDAASILLNTVNLHGRASRKCADVFEKIEKNSPNHMVAALPDITTKIIAYPLKGSNAKRIKVVEAFVFDTRLKAMKRMLKELKKENKRLANK